jgi:AcrR family transcriptional regulator
VTEERGAAEGSSRPPPQVRILQAASDLFGREGTIAVGVDRIIDRADTAKATLYKRFRSKDDLVLSWLRTPDARWLDRVAAEVERRSSDPVARIVLTMDVLKGWFEDDAFHGCPFTNTCSDVRDPHHPIRGEIRAYLDEVREWLRDLAVTSGAEHPDDLARELHTVIAGTICLAFATSRSEPASAGRRAMVALLAEGLGISRAEVEARSGKPS